VMRDLVDDRLSHLGNHLCLRGANRTNRVLEKGYPVGHDAAVATWAPSCQGNTFVQSEEGASFCSILDDHSHVLHGRTELSREGIQCVGDELLESIARDYEHARTIRGSRCLGRRELLVELTWPLFPVCQ